MTGAGLLLAFVHLSRLGELILAQRNTAALLRRGAQEIAAGHYPLTVALHAAWLSTLWVIGTAQPVHLGWLALFGVVQVARVWVLATLGRRWTTRILVEPGETLVRRGLYRYFSHPNYLVGIAEIAVLPLSLGPPGVAVIFTARNAAVLESLDQGGKRGPAREPSR